MPIRRIGLTGGIGSGKSTVAALWVARGAKLIDTDGIAHEITAPGGVALAALAREFGSEVIGADGALDRVRMRAIAFADPGARRRLEGHLHPIIGALALQRAQQADEAVVLFDVPLLSESSAWRDRCDRILVVDCSETTQVERVKLRSGWTASQVQQVIAQQASRSQRRAVADAVIYNDDGCAPAQLADLVDGLWRLWVAPAHA
jgi:dephospho-CoA kinase